jgi:hypothetical protein
MARIEDQRILVWCNKEKNLLHAILDAALLSGQLEKELCLFANYNTQKQQAQYETKLKGIAHNIKAQIPSINVSTLLLKGKLHELIPLLGEEYNCVMLCFGCKVNLRLLKAFYRSGFPFYFAKENTNPNNRLQKVIIPVDFRSATKDAILWGSYLGRFNRSEVVLLEANDKSDNALKRQVAQNISSAKNLYVQFLFNYWIETGSTGSWGIHREAMHKASGFDLLVFTGSLNVTPPDYLIGPFEKRIINRCTKPVLLINPQKEMYLLCG